MKRFYNEKISEIKMDKTDFDLIKEKIQNNKTVSKPENRILKIAVSAAAIIALMFCFPQVRTFASNTINKFVVFTFFDGTKGEMTEGEDYTAVSIEESPVEEDFFTVEDGKLYFVYDGSKADITDKVGGNNYFRFEITRQNGKSVLFIGGDAGNYGWRELVFDANGNYITNRMCVPTGNSANNDNNEEVFSDPDWLEIAMHNEGVPCGNPELDSKLENND